MKVAIYGQAYQDGALDYVLELLDELHKVAADISIEEDFYKLLRSKRSTDSYATFSENQGLDPSLGEGRLARYVHTTAYRGSGGRCHCRFAPVELVSSRPARQARLFEVRFSRCGRAGGPIDRSGKGSALVFRKASRRQRSRPALPSHAPTHCA